MTAVSDGISTTLEDAVWWEMEVPCASVTDCSAPAKWITRRPCCPKTQVLCRAHAAKRAHKLAMWAVEGVTHATCPHCADVFSVAGVVLRPL